ncbi:MAG: CoA transferase [Gammaproteobacteria bacterium]|nr:CoA transferase [Gammaproteobacteria bacterium]
MEDAKHEPFLNGIKVLDMGSFVAAPAAATVMADYGADVIKIEPPDGDGYRRLLAAAPVDHFWMLTSRSKRSLALDLKSDDGAEILHRLVRWADVFVTNYRDSLLDKLGLTYAALAELNPRLVYAHVSGYGRRGPEAGRPAFDTTAWWGRSGLQEFTRDEGAPPIISAPGMGDHATAMSLFGAIMAALYRRERSGRGALVETSLLANGVWSNGMVMQAMLAGDDWSTRKHEGERPRHPLASLYQTRDERWVQLSLLNPVKEWAPFTEAMLHPEWQQDSRFADAAQRLEHADALIPLIAQAIGALTLEELRRRLDERGLTYGYAAQNRELVADPQLIDNDILIPTADSEGPYTRTVANPIHISGEVQRTPTRAPGVGEHSVAILQELGCSAGEIDRWLAARSVIAP